MLNERTRTIYNLVCDDCGTYGPDAFSKSMAKSNAEAEGWHIDSFYNGIRYIARHYCLDCKEKSHQKVDISKLTRGTQVVYIPQHANGDRNHPDCEPGFITTIHSSKQAAFVRYWHKPELRILRTVANSELTHFADLIVCDSVPQEQVKKALKEYCQ